MLLPLSSIIQQSNSKKGFTLVEVIVSLAILVLAVVGIGSLAVTISKVTWSTKQYAAADLDSMKNIEIKKENFDGMNNSTVSGIYAMSAMLNNSLYNPGSYCNLITSGTDSLLVDGQADCEIKNGLEIKFLAPESGRQEVVFNNSVSRVYPADSMRSFRLNLIITNNEFPSDEFKIKLTADNEKDVPQDFLIRTVNYFTSDNSSDKTIKIEKNEGTSESIKTRLEQIICLNKNYISGDTLYTKLISSTALQLAVGSTKDLADPALAYNLAVFESTDNVAGNTNIIVMSESDGIKHAVITTDSTAVDASINVSFMIKGAAVTQQGISYLGGSLESFEKEKAGTDALGKKSAWLTQIDQPVTVKSRRQGQEENKQITTRSSFAIIN